EERVRELIVGYGERLSVAAVNGPRTVVVSGEPGALEELLGWCEGEGVRARRVAVDYASHSAQVEEIEEELGELLGGIAPRPGRGGGEGGGGGGGGGDCAWAGGGGGEMGGGVGGRRGGRARGRGGVGFYSRAEGRFQETGELDGGYWYRNLRRRVGFEAGVRA